MSAPHTAGPWRWELSEQSKRLHLVGGKPLFDLTIMDFTRWGMNDATVCLRDTAHDGFNLMHKLHERRDWIAPFPGREHHAKWCANVTHPDMRLIAAAPDLLASLQALHAICANCNLEVEGQRPTEEQYATAMDAAAVAIAKATGVAS